MCFHVTAVKHASFACAVDLKPGTGSSVEIVRLSAVRVEVAWPLRG